jgi:hypothetical protein
LPQHLTYAAYAAYAAYAYVTNPDLHQQEHPYHRGLSAGFWWLTRFEAL